MGLSSLSRTMKTGMSAVKGLRSGFVRRISSRCRDERAVMCGSWREASFTEMGDGAFGGEVVILFGGWEFGVR